MWNPFKSKPLLSDEDRDFQFESFKWLLTHFGSTYFYDATNLVLPTDEFFPTEVSTNQDAAHLTFQQVLELAGLASWPVVLKAQKEDPDLQVAPTVVVQITNTGPAGTFSVDENEKVTIT